MLIIFIGPPGSGKGTQAERICTRLDIAHLSTGDMLRAAIEAETELGSQAAAYMQRGELVPDQLVVEMVGESLGRANSSSGCLLDGFPRSLPQAEALDGLLQREGKQLSQVIELDVPDEELVQRLLARKRPDDTSETIQNRLQVYQQQTRPLLDYYQQRGLLESVRGSGTMEEVEERIQAVLPTRD